MPAYRFNPPPGWPAPPPEWTPPEGWEPDPTWPPAPDDWEWWTPDEPLIAAPPVVHGRASVAVSVVPPEVYSMEPTVPTARSRVVAPVTASASVPPVVARASIPAAAPAVVPHAGLIGLSGGPGKSLEQENEELRRQLSTLLGFDPAALADEAHWRQQQLRRLRAEEAALRAQIVELQAELREWSNRV